MCFAPSIAESGAQIVAQSDSLAALSVAMKPSSAKMLMDAFAAEIVVLVELSDELMSTRHIQGVLDVLADACTLSQGAFDS